jgi:hypothetical protein
MFKHTCRACKKEYENETFASRKCPECIVPKGKYYREHKKEEVERRMQYARDHKEQEKIKRDELNAKKRAIKEKSARHGRLIKEGKKKGKYIVYRGRLIRLDRKSNMETYEEHMSHD